MPIINYARSFVRFSNFLFCQFDNPINFFKVDVLLSFLFYYDRLQPNQPLALDNKDAVEMFFDGRFPSLAKTATDIAVVGMFLDRSDKGWFLTESLWGPQGSVLKREPRARDLARLLSCVLGQETLLSKYVHPVYPQEYNWVLAICQESLKKYLKGRGGSWEPASLHPVHPREYNWVLANC